MKVKISVDQIITFKQVIELTKEELELLKKKDSRDVYSNDEQFEIIQRKIDKSKVSDWQGGYSELQVEEC